MPYKPYYNKEWYSNLSTKIKTYQIYDLKSLGTLGYGNKSELTQNSYITIHSGSIYANIIKMLYLMADRLTGMILMKK